MIVQIDVYTFSLFHVLGLSFNLGVIQIKSQIFLVIKMAIDIYSGDPRLILTVNGSKILYRAGQPLMDQGIENQAFLSLLVPPGWVGNSLVVDVEERLESDFLQTAKGPINLKKLSQVEQSAVRALDDPIFGEVTATATNPTSASIVVDILIKPPGSDAFTLRLESNGQNWVFQKLNPANERI